MMRPLCRYCGKPIAKRTDYVYFGCAPHEAENDPSRRVEQPHTRAEAQRLVNMEIIAVRWGTTARETGGTDMTVIMGTQIGSGRPMSRTKKVPRFIERVSVWDGESYADQFFCGTDHAARFGYACAHEGSLSVKAYRDALARQGS